MLTDRMKTSVLIGSLLGIICILGSGYRTGFAGNWILLWALWYNRFLMGIVIGLVTNNKRHVAIIRGAILGLLVSFAYYFTTGFADVISFIAGGVYGIIIDYLASRHQWITAKLKDRIFRNNKISI